MNETTKNLLIGLFVVVACSLLVYFVMFLKPSVGDGKETLYVRFSNINRVAIGTRVTFAGKPVGEVTAIREIYDARKMEGSPSDQVYFYELILKVDSHVHVYTTDEITLQTSGLLGEKSVAIIPRVPPPGVTPVLITNQPVYAESADPIEAAFNQLSDLAKSMQGTFNNISSWLDKNSDELGHAVKSFASAMDQADAALNAFNESDILTDIQTAAKSFTATTDEIKNVIEGLKQDDVFTNIAAIATNISSASASIDTITSDIAEGNGTLGKLIKGDDMYLRVTAIMSKIDTMMNDINHYGILFHLNKGWQRMRTRQMNLINSLATPNDFRQYFTSEVDCINTAMERLSTVIDQVERSPDRDKIFESTAFKADFAELLREVDELSSNLRLYNQQLNEAQQACERGEN